MGQNRNENDSTWLQRFIADAREYIQHCFGVNDVRTRYEHDLNQLKKNGTDQPPKQKFSDGYEATSKMD